MNGETCIHCGLFVPTGYQHNCLYRPSMTTAADRIAQLEAELAQARRWSKAWKAAAKHEKRQRKWAELGRKLLLTFYKKLIQGVEK